MVNVLKVNLQRSELPAFISSHAGRGYTNFKLINLASNATVDLIEVRAWKT